MRSLLDSHMMHDSQLQRTVHVHCGLHTNGTGMPESWELCILTPNTDKVMICSDPSRQTYIKQSMVTCSSACQSCGIAQRNWNQSCVGGPSFSQPTQSEPAHAGHSQIATLFNAGQGHQTGCVTSMKPLPHDTFIDETSLWVEACFDGHWHVRAYACMGYHKMYCMYSKKCVIGHALRGLLQLTCMWYLL